MQRGNIYYFDSDCIIPSNYLVEVESLKHTMLSCFGDDKALDSFSDKKAIISM
jgi:hypothetical protein